MSVVASGCFFVLKVSFHSGSSIVKDVSGEELSSFTKVCLTGSLPGIHPSVVVQFAEAVGLVHVFPYVILAQALENVHIHMLPGTI